MIFSELFLFSLFPILVVLSYANLSSLASLAWSMVFASAFFVGVVTYRKLWYEMLNPQLWKYSFYIALFVGVLFYGLFFVGLEYTTPGNASIIILFQVFTTFLFFNIYRGEHISFDHKVGAILMIAGALVILGKGWSGINVGDLLILGGTFCTPIGNFFQKRAREIASSESVMLLRSLITLAFIFPILYIVGSAPTFGDIQTSLVFLLINGILLLGLAKILWIEGIHRMSVTKAIALASIAPFFTLFFSWLILGQMPTQWQLLSLAPFIIGVLLLTDQIRFHRTESSLRVNP